jgi:hypothetical protein
MLTERNPPVQLCDVDVLDGSRLVEDALHGSKAGLSSINFRVSLYASYPIAEDLQWMFAECKTLGLQSLRSAKFDFRWEDILHLLTAQKSEISGQVSAFSIKQYN